MSNNQGNSTTTTTTVAGTVAGTSAADEQPNMASSSNSANQSNSGDRSTSMSQGGPGGGGSTDNRTGVIESKSKKRGRSPSDAPSAYLNCFSNVSASAPRDEMESIIQQLKNRLQRQRAQSANGTAGGTGTNPQETNDGAQSEE